MRFRDFQDAGDRNLTDEEHPAQGNLKGRRQFLGGRGQKNGMTIRGGEMARRRFVGHGNGALRGPAKQTDD